MSVEQNKEVERRVIEEVFNKRSLAITPELIANEYVYHGPGGMELKGPEGFRQLVSMNVEAFPDLLLTIEDMVGEGDKVVVRFVGHGTHKGELMGMPPTGKQVMGTGIVIARLSGGKAVEAWENYDQLSMLQQLGLFPRQP